MLVSKIFTVIVILSVLCTVSCASVPDVSSHRNKECAELYYSMLKMKQDLTGLEIAMIQMELMLI
mgnify:CR=1 FL=1